MNMRHTMEELASRGHEVHKHYHFNTHAFYARRKVMWSMSRISNPKFHLADLG